jgi:hypothetical protein
MLGAAISAAGSLAGGLLGNKGAKDAAKLAYAQKVKWALEGPTHIRKGAEDAGFNPLVFAGAQTYNPSPVAPGSNGLAEASEAISRGFERRRDARIAAANARLAQQNTNKRLQLERERIEAIKRGQDIQKEIALAQVHSRLEKAKNGARNAKANADAGKSPYADPTNPDAFTQKGEYIKLPWWLGGKIKVSRDRSTADATQRAWGEGGDAVSGAAWMIDDWMSEMARRYSGVSREYDKRIQRLKNEARKKGRYYNHKEGW